jgi:hypothetical protein
MKGKSLLLFCNIETDSFERISCYEIYPTSEDPHFSRLGTLSVDGENNQTNISKDYLVYYQHDESILTVWKYAAQGLGVSWVVSHPGDLYEVCYPSDSDCKSSFHYL